MYTGSRCGIWDRRSEFNQRLAIYDILDILNFTVAM